MHIAHRMNLTSRLLLAGVFLGSLVSAHAKIERVVEKTFTVPQPGVLRVETQGGGIRVEPATDGTVKVTAKQRIRADSETEADEVLKKLELTIEQQGNDIVVRSKYASRPTGFRWGSWPPVQVDFVIAAPAAFRSELRTSGGGVTVGDMAGELDVRTSGGAITLGRIGAAVTAHTSGGGISLKEAAGPAQLTTSGGSINVGRVIEAAELSTSGGGIRVDSAEGGKLRAHTSGGGIRADFKGPLKEDSVLSTSGGSVRVTVDANAAFRLDASSSGGGVDAAGLTITLENDNRSRGRLAGAVNGGGPALKLRSSGGGVSIRTR